MSDLPFVSVEIATRNRGRELGACLTSLAAQDYPRERIEILVYDAGSRPEEKKLGLEQVQKLDGSGFSGIRFIEGEGVNLLISRHILLDAADPRTELMLCLDDDGELEKDTLRRLVETISKDQAVAAVGPRIASFFNPAVTLHGANMVGNWTGRFIFTDPGRELPCDWLNTTCLLFRRKAFELVGGLDESFEAAHEEADVCLRLKKAGFKIVYQPLARATHKLDFSVPKRDKFYFLYRNKLWFIRKNFTGPRLVTAVMTHAFAGTVRYLLESLRFYGKINPAEWKMIFKAVGEGIFSPVRPRYYAGKK